MLDPPQIIVFPEQRLTAVLRVDCTCEEIHLVMGRGVRELLDTIHAQGVVAAGSLYTHHLRLPTDCFELEIGVPVNRLVESTGRVRAGAWPGMRAARTVYRGRYEDLPQFWRSFRLWVREQGLRATDDLWECYLSGPECGQDATRWRTELIQPLHAH